MQNPAFQPDVTAALRRINSYSQVVKRSKPKADVWFFDSPKNDKRVSVIGDLLFMHIVLLEGDTSVSKYVLKEPADDAQEHDPAIRVYRDNGGVEWWDVVWESASRKRQKNGRSRAKLAADAREGAAIAAGATYVEKTERDLLTQSIFFDNWLNLCAAITRCRSLSLADEAAAFHQLCAKQATFTVGDLLALEDLDPAHMLALIGLSLQRGALETNLTSELFGSHTVLRRTRS